MMEDKLNEEDVNKDIMLPIALEEYRIFTPPPEFKGHFHSSAIAVHGCINCSWRGTYLCPYKFAAGKVTKRRHPVWKGLVVPENIKIDGICKYKKDYLTLLAGEWDTAPTFDQWNSRLLKNKGLIQNNQDETRYLNIAKQLEELEENYEEQSKILDSESLKQLTKEINAKKKEFEGARANYIQTWGMLQTFLDKQVDRETVKKMDITNTRTMKLEEIQSIMRGEVIDAEYTKEGDDKCVED